MSEKLRKFIEMNFQIYAEEEVVYSVILTKNNQIGYGERTINDTITEHFECTECSQAIENSLEEVKEHIKRKHPKEWKAIEKELKLKLFN